MTDDTTDDEHGTDDPLRPTEIAPGEPEEFGLVQAWWGDGKGKTTAALGMGLRAAGHGYRVHLLQFMKGGTSTVEDVRGEYAALEALPGASYENSGHYGWHGFHDGSDDDEHEARAQGGLARAREIVDASRGVDGSLPLDGDPEDGVHMLILDEILYAAGRGLVDLEDVLDLIRDKPDGLELVLTGSHEEPTYLLDEADLVTEVRKQRHPIENGHSARKGTEF
ncbi:cob(I)yrinic acid a,c-diamide adenosyltransferase [Halobacterium jilantaiense]|uniref:Cob(I)yrinic acid a,c-diamide adenosyltransferase n=1 Tax=Halobacterium jilantaiense TaxID=355548 RepID=A0A1I0QM35_9EURY|nr:cob(I)yrinic acid a,c-diamide adenosyltransferase [Halobacterium jilantaiense]SEW28400.1 cob(I)yrinic acid a,c-diamide adenosyltransferase [Halobacterium jilantaiense]